MSQEEIERLMGGMSQPAAAQPAAPPPVQQQAPVQPQYAPVQQAPVQPQYAPVQQAPVQPQYAPVQQMPVQPQYIQAPVMQPQYQMESKVINARPVQLPTLDVAKEIGEEQAENLELIMSVPLEVSVEIGRTRRKVEDILTFSKGSLVVLDKLAGDQVDLFVNGLCVARGDVVVVDDNFGVRITEVLKQPKLLDMAKKS